MPKIIKADPGKVFYEYVPGEGNIIIGDTIYAPEYKNISDFTQATLEELQDIQE